MQRHSIRFLSASIALLVLVLCRTVLGQTDSTLFNLSTALFALDEKNLYEPTAEALELYLVQYPENPRAGEAQYSLASLHERRGQRDRAYLAYLKLVRLYPDDPKKQLAATQAQEIVKKDRSLSPIREKLSSLLESKSDDTDIANRFYDMLVDVRDLIYPRLNEALIRECCFFARTFPDDSRTPLVTSWSGDLLSDDGDHWEALAAYLRVVHLFRGSDLDLICRLKIGDLFGYHLKQPETAIQTYESVLRSSEADSLIKSDAQWKLARVLHEKQKSYDWAVKEYQILITRYPFSPTCVDALISKADLEVSKLKQYEKGIATYRQVATLFPADPKAAEALVLAGEVYEKKLKDYEQAIGVYREAAEQYPTRALSQNVLFKAAELAEKKLNDSSRALELYQEVVDLFGGEKVAADAAKRIEAIQQKQE